MIYNMLNNRKCILFPAFSLIYVPTFLLDFISIGTHTLERQQYLHQSDVWNTYKSARNMVCGILGRAVENNISTIMLVAVKSRVDNKNARHVHRAKRYRCAWKPNHKNAHIHINSPSAYFSATKGRLKKYIIYTARVRLFSLSLSLYIYIYYMHLCVWMAW